MTEIGTYCVCHRAREIFRADLLSLPSAGVASLSLSPRPNARRFKIANPDRVFLTLTTALSTECVNIIVSDVIQVWLDN